MPQKRRKESSILFNQEHTFGWIFVEEREKCEDAFEEKIEDGYVWIKEVLIEIKRSLKTPEVNLCPKTPSKKKKRSRRKVADTSGNESFAKRQCRGRNSGGTSQESMECEQLLSTDSQDDDSTQTRTTRSRAAKKKASAKSSRARALNLNNVENGPEPILNLQTKNKGVTFDGSANSDKEAATVTTSGSDYASSSDETQPRNSSHSAITQSLSSAGSLSGEDISSKGVEDAAVTDAKRNTPVNNCMRAAVRSPITAIKTAIRSRNSGNTSAKNSPVASVRTQSPIGSVRTQSPIGSVRTQSPSGSVRTQSPSTSRAERLLEDSPRRQKAIPNFSVLNVKQKASAYEEHITKKIKAEAIKTELLKTPQHARRVTRSSLARRSNQPCDAAELRSVTHAQPVRRSTRVSGVKSGVRMSLTAQRRSSAMRRSVRSSLSMTKQTKERVNESLRVTPEKQPMEGVSSTAAVELLSYTKAIVKPRLAYQGRGENGVKLGTVRKFRSPVLAAKPRPRSKPRLCEVVTQPLSKKSPAMLLKTNTVTGKTRAGSPYAQQARSTRSKLRLNKVHVPVTLAPESSSSDEAARTPTQPPPVKSTRSKMRLNKAPPPQLPDSAAGTDDEDAVDSKDDVDALSTPRRGERHARLPTPPSSDEFKKIPANESPEQRSDAAVHDQASGGRKRSQPMSEETDEQSTPPKRRLVDSEGEEIVEGTPQKKSGPRIIKPVRGGQTDSANKRGNINYSVKSFIQRNTPQKKTLKELEEERRRNLEMKAKEAERRLAKREELQQRRRLELKSKREERQKRVATRREQQDKQDLEAKRDIIVHKQLDVSKNPRKLIEEKFNKVKEEREKKMAEVEQRRRQEEEARLQRLKEQEEEKRRQEEQQVRRREQEERERMRKMAEQRRLEEERRAEQERERQRELARKQALEEEARRHEEAERREREERERRERAERERQEMLRQQERERQKREEAEKRKELELKKLREERARDQERQREERARDHDRLREEREVATMIKKHNQSLQSTSSTTAAVQPQQATSSVTSQQAATSTTQPLSQQTSQSKLNTSYTVSKPQAQHQQHAGSGSQDSDTYEMTPVRKKKSKSNSEENYGIDDLHSDDSTDEEEQPRKTIPNWAVGAQLKAQLIHQYYHPPDLDNIFDIVVPPNLNDMFVKKRARFNKRTSSAVWDSPILKPSVCLPN